MLKAGVIWYSISCMEIELEVGGNCEYDLKEKGVDFSDRLEFLASSCPLPSCLEGSLLLTLDPAFHIVRELQGRTKSLSIIFFI